MRMYQTRWFSKWAKREDVSDQNLRDAVAEIVKGLIDANLGGFVYKKRIPLPGRGKRGGARTLVAYNKGDIIFFIFGFAKNEKDNIHDKELQTLKLLACDLLSYTEEKLNNALENEEFVEINNE